MNTGGYYVAANALIGGSALGTDIQAALTAAGYTDVTAAGDGTSAVTFTAAATGTVLNPSTFSLLGVSVTDGDGLAKNLSRRLARVLNRLRVQLLRLLAEVVAAASICGTLTTDKDLF